MATPPDNKALMREAVQHWITAAQTHPRGAELLRNKVAWVEKQMRDLGHPDTPVPAHLEGLTAFDLASAHSELFAASMKAPA